MKMLPPDVANMIKMLPPGVFDMIMPNLEAILQKDTMDFISDILTKMPFGIDEMLSGVLTMLPPEFVDVYRQTVAVMNIVMDDILRALNSKLCLII